MDAARLDGADPDRRTILGPVSLRIGEGRAGSSSDPTAPIAAIQEAARDPGEHASVLVTHHPEEIPSSVTHAALLREGDLVAAGPIHHVFTQEALGACLGLAGTVGEHAGRWNVTARTP